MAQIAKKPTINKKVTVAQAKVQSEPIFKVVKYTNKRLPISPRKLRLLVNKVKKLSPGVALTQLQFTNTKSARILIKAIKNVIADAKNNFSVDTDTLKFEAMKVDEGMKLKRMDKSHGSRFARGVIQKRHSRLEIQVKGVQK